MAERLSACAQIRGVVRRGGVGDDLKSLFASWDGRARRWEWRRERGVPAAGETFDWQGAVDYCDALDLGGHSDWYLPSRADFIWLLGGCDEDVLGGSFGYCLACDGSDTCSGLFGSDSSTYWTADVLGVSSYSWCVSFDTGYLSYIGNDNSYSVRCARSGP